MSGTSRVIPAETLFARIGTRDPYFALREVASDGHGSVEAEVPIELKSEREAGPITAAEAARHLGLLASCALSEVNRSKELHYHLSRVGTLDRPSSAGTPTASKLVGHARGEMLTADAARVTAELHTRAGVKLFALELEMTVLTTEQFQKLFDGVKRDLRKSVRPPVDDRRPTGELKVMRNNPYGAPLAFANMDASPGADLIEATFGPISADACTGHFPMYPVLPTGIVMAALSQLSGELLKRRRQDDAKYVVRHAEARADNLAVLGETVRFEARYVGGSSRNHRFECRARCGVKQVGESSLTLALV